MISQALNQPTISLCTIDLFVFTECLRTYTRYALWSSIRIVGFTAQTNFVSKFNLLYLEANNNSRD